MKLLLQAQRIKLLKNSQLTGEALTNGTPEPRHYPVVKFFNPCGAATWLITEMDEDGRLFGLCDIGQGTPELGYVMLDELASIRLPFGLSIERDMHFKAKKPVEEYASEARQAGRIAA